MSILTITVKIDVQKDADNWWHGSNQQSYGIDWKKRIGKRLQRRVVGKTKGSAFRFLIPYLRRLYGRIHIERERDFAQSFFNNKRTKIFQRMEKVTGRKIYRNDFSCFLTTFPRAPYDTKSGCVWLPINWGRRSLINVFLHELLHFQTTYYFKKRILRKLKSHEFENLKEALTVILNHEFRKLLTREDRGYRVHAYLRKELLRFWIGTRDFGKLIAHGVDVYPVFSDTIAYLQFGKYTRGCPEFLMTKVKRIRSGTKGKKYVEKILNTIKKEFNPSKHKTTKTRSFSQSRYTSVRDVLKKRQLSCGSMATVVTSVFRTLGLPTKLVNGLYTKNNPNMRHAWNEIYVPTLGRFVPFDITRKDFKLDRFHVRQNEWVDWDDLRKAGLAVKVSREN